MDVETANRKMEELELAWFEADTVAKSTHEQLTAYRSSKNNITLLLDLQARLERAQREKQDIMREIESIEDSLIAEWTAVSMGTRRPGKN